MKEEYFHVRKRSKSRKLMKRGLGAIKIVESTWVARGDNVNGSKTLDIGAIIAVITGSCPMESRCVQVELESPLILNRIRICRLERGIRREMTDLPEKIVLRGMDISPIRNVTL